MYISVLQPFRIFFSVFKVLKLPRIIRVFQITPESMVYLFEIRVRQGRAGDLNHNRRSARASRRLRALPLQENSFGVPLLLH